MQSEEPVVVHFDESGNTGENLSDSAQPVFAFAGVRLDDDEAADLVAQVSAKLGWTAPDELKSKSLLRNGRTQQVLLEVLGELPEDAAFAVVADKEYVAATKLVDLLVVEAMDAEGYNMYEDGSAKGIGLLYFHTGPVIGDRSAWQHLLACFVDMAAGKQNASPLVFFQAVEGYLATVQLDDHPFDMLRTVASESWRLWADRRDGTQKDVLDPALALFAKFCEEIGRRVGPFKAVCDESAVIERHVSLVMNVGSVVDLANPGTYLPPTPITALEFADSTVTPQIQVADWVAATVRRYAVTLLRDSTAKPVLPGFKELVDNWMVANLWPDDVDEYFAGVRTVQQPL
ncbi:DUF3800 domain-containing protein [Lentzea sp. NPDC051213]|uniref:DUF3800 domain-containing protein n=1 Tax=Lentzea sp. NPDC051213 TaxID=3364126 RepID=UPI003798C64F